MFVDKVILDTDLPSSSYLNNVMAVKHLKKRPLELKSNVTILIGENGTGKSTLIEAIAIACRFNAEGGTRNFTKHSVDANSDLHEYITIVKNRFFKDGFFLRAESFFNIATYVDDIGAAHNYGGKSLHNQSHGESFLSLIANRFFGEGLYILDEPEAALSPTRILSLMSVIHELEKQGAQFIIATHSPILMSYPNADVFLISELGIEMVDYRQTEHYTVTRRMLEAPESVFKYLFES